MQHVLKVTMTNGAWCDTSQFKEIPDLVLQCSGSEKHALCTTLIEDSVFLIESAWVQQLIVLMIGMWVDVMEKNMGNGGG